MIRDFLSRYPYGALSGAGLLLFMGVFFAAVWATFRRGSRERHAYLGSLPFSEAEPRSREEAR